MKLLCDSQPGVETYPRRNLVNACESALDLLRSRHRGAAFPTFISFEF
jgi:hypothetical protein